MLKLMANSDFPLCHHLRSDLKMVQIGWKVKTEICPYFHWSVSVPEENIQIKDYSSYLNENFKG